jgi:hypothetical protein
MSSREPPWLPAEPPTESVVRPPEHWPSTPRAPVATEPQRRAWAAIVIAQIGVVVGVITAFAPWATYVDGVELTGIEHGDGWFVLVVAAAAAALVGALAFGWRHLVVRVGLIAASAALFLLFLLNRIDISRSHDYVTGGRIDVGGGLYGVAAAACLVLTGALIIPTTPREGPPA